MASLQPMNNESFKYKTVINSGKLRYKFVKHKIKTI